VLHLNRLRHREEEIAATDPADRPRRAIDLFNRSDAADTVRRLTRMLGAPRVSVGAAAGGRHELRLTVAWELSWYQWAIDPENRHFPVRELGRGESVGELDLSARMWNARGLADGQISLGAVDAAAEEAA
jgi:hypothetical protein